MSTVLWWSLAAVGLLQVAYAFWSARHNGHSAWMSGYADGYKHGHEDGAAGRAPDAVVMKKP